MINILYFRSHILQADSKEMYEAWISAMQKGIGAAFQRLNTEPSSHGLHDSRIHTSNINVNNGSVHISKVKKVRYYKLIK